MHTEKKEVKGKLRTVGTLEIDYNSQQETIEILKLSFGEDLTLRNKHTKVKIVAGQPSVEVDQAKLTLGSLQLAIVTAPFDITEEGIGDLDKDVATEILQAYNELNNPSEKKNLN